MKNVSLALALAATTAFASFSASAAPYQDGFFFKPYVGLDYQYDHLTNERSGGISSNQVLEDDLNGGDVHIGARIHKNLGFELGYEGTEEGKKSNVLGTGVNTSVQQYGTSFDALGYIPVTPKFDIIGSLGVARIRTEAKVSNGGGTVTGDRTKGRYGVGAEYWLTDHVNLRSIVRYEGEDFDDNNVNNSVLVSAGVNVQF